MVEIVWLASVGVRLKVCVDYSGIYGSFVFLLLASMCVCWYKCGRCLCREGTDLAWGKTSRSRGRRE